MSISNLLDSEKKLFNKSYTTMELNNFKIDHNSYTTLHNRPLSIERKTLIVDSFDLTLPDSGELILPLETFIFNELELEISNNILSASQLVLGSEYVELFANIEVDTPNNSSISLDISGIDGDFFEIIDTRETSKNGNFYLTFGSHIFLPSDWETTSQFVFKLVNNTNQSSTIKKIKLKLKSHYIQEN